MNVITATGKEFPSDFFVEHRPSKSVYFRVQDTDLANAETVFSNPEETEVIWYGTTRFDGFTDLDFISDEGDAIKVRLIKNAINNNAEP